MAPTVEEVLYVRNSLIHPCIISVMVLVYRDLVHRHSASFNFLALLSCALYDLALLFTVQSPHVPLKSKNDYADANYCIIVGVAIRGWSYLR